MNTRFHRNCCCDCNDHEDCRRFDFALVERGGNFFVFGAQNFIHTLTPAVGNTSSNI